MKKTIRLIVIAAAFIVILIVVISSSRDTSYKREATALTADTLGLDKEVPVAGIKLEPAEFYEMISATGVLEAWNRTIVSSETGGRVTGWNAELGEYLEKGQVIINLDDEVAELQWHQAEAALESTRIGAAKARRDFERQQSLYKKGDLSDNLVEVSELALKQAEAGLKAAEAAAGLAGRAYRETKVRMPFTGRLSAKLVVTGQSVMPGAPVAEVVQTSPIKITVSLSENDIVKVQPGQEVAITTVGKRGDRVFIGTVHAVGAAADAASRMFPVEIAVPNKGLEIRPGMAASVSILVKVYRDALIAPQDALNDYGDKVSCFIMQDNRVVERDISISQSHAGMVMLLTGASPGDTLITVGGSGLKSGQKVFLTIEE